MRTWTGSVTIATDLSSLVVFEFILEEYKPSSAPVLWQGGREGGRARGGREGGKERRKGIEGNGISTMYMYACVCVCAHVLAVNCYNSIRYCVYSHVCGSQVW